jgi:hypothetical protein
MNARPTVFFTVMPLIRRPTGEKNRTPSQPPTNFASDVWMVIATCSPQARNMLVTSLAICAPCQGRREGAQHGKRCSQHGKSCSQHRKSCSQHGKSVRNTMFGCWSQHVRHKLATCSPQTRNITRNMYTMSREEGGGATCEKVFATWEKVFAT